MRGAVRIVELSAWILGITLLCVYGVIRYRQTQASEASIAAFQLTHQDEADPAAGVVANEDPRVDMSTWSAQRIAAYRASASPDVVPEALLRLPRLRLTVPVFADTSEPNLNRGAGFIEGTRHSGAAAGNVGIAAHRDGFFRSLKDVRVGDTLLLEEPSFTYVYEVVATRVVAPTDVEVLQQTARATVTLVTCYPFYFVGSAPQRFIVQARRSVASRDNNSALTTQTQPAEP